MRSLHCRIVDILGIYKNAERISQEDHGRRLDTLYGTGFCVSHHPLQRQIVLPILIDVVISGW